MEFFDELKRLCKIRGITIDELMKKIGKSGIPVYAGWRQRGCYPRADDLYKISKILGVSMEHFFEDNFENVVPENKSVIAKKIEETTPLDNLNESQLKTLNDLMKIFEVLSPLLSISENVKKFS